MESPCKGGLDVSEKALLSMLGTPRFSKKTMTSFSEQRRAEILEAIDDAENNLDVAASKLGLTKSSLKRIVSANQPSVSADDENNHSGMTRKYLEKTMGRWSVETLNPENGAACIKMMNRSGNVRLSVNVRLISGT